MVAWYRDLKAWGRRHRRALWAAAGVAGVGAGTYLLVSSLRARAEAEREGAAQSSLLLRKAAEERSEAQLQTHFESIQKISDATTLPTLLPQLKARLFELVDLSSLTEKLMSAKDDPRVFTSREKLGLWQELKVMSFTRTVCAMCSLSLLVLFIRTQLNILGRHVYFDTARDMSVARAGEQSQRLSMSCQHKFIAFADYFPHRGVDSLMRHVRAAVDTVLRATALKEPFTVSELREVVQRILQKFHDSQDSWVNYILPTQNSLPEALVAMSPSLDGDVTPVPVQESFGVHDAEQLDQLMSESRSILSSDEFAEVLRVALDKVLETVVEDFAAFYKGNPDSGIPLAKLLPPVASTGNALLAHPNENRFVQILAQLPQVQSFCAMVYSTSGGSGNSR